jgi:hypothetical protein
MADTNANPMALLELEDQIAEAERDFQDTLVD